MQNAEYKFKKLEWGTIFLTASLLLLQLQSFLASPPACSAHPADPQQAGQEKLKIVSTTSLIACIVERVGKDKVHVVTIVPSGMCPGHFDIKPGDVKVLEEAQILLEHGFEGELFVEDMVKLVENPELVRAPLNIEGNWMVPDIHIQAVDKIVEVLSRVEPKYITLFKSRAHNYKEEIRNLSGRTQQKAKELKVGKTKVICSEMQAEFVDWIGFDVVFTYGRPDSFSAHQLREIIEKCKLENVKLVIDNLQSGADAGKPIASEIRRAHTTLTNFPLEYGGKFSYLKSLKANADKLFANAY